MSVSFQCFNCKHYLSDLRCDAFHPGKIPEEIVTGRASHLQPYEGDNGIQFEPIDDDESDETSESSE